MNTTQRSPYWGEINPNDSIESNYQEWLKQYTQMISLLRKKEKFITIKSKKIPKRVFIAAHCQEANKFLEKAIKAAGEKDQQLLKIKALLLLIKLHDHESEKEIREKYFSHAVEIARKYLWDIFQGTPDEEALIEMYLSHIDPILNENLRIKDKDSRNKILYSMILSWSGNKMWRWRERIQSILSQSNNNKLASDKVLEKLENIVGATRLLIISEDSDKPIMCHGFTSLETAQREVEYTNMYHLTVNVFDKNRKYVISVDRGSAEPVNQFEENELNDIINPLLSLFIKEKEWELYMSFISNIDDLEEWRGKKESPAKRTNYHSFIDRVVDRCVNPLEFHESDEDKGYYIDSVIKAIDICRHIVLWSKNIPQEINRILWGNINRDVLDKVKYLLLSQYETCSGYGYPSGLSKKYIPLEWRMYAIIHSYEILLSKRYLSQREVIETMKKWAQEGYLDDNILQVFLETISEKHTEPNISTSSVQIDRKLVPQENDQNSQIIAYYTPFVEQCSMILSKIKTIKLLYHTGRIENRIPGRREDLFKESDRKYKSELYALTDMVTTFVITRHDETESDEKRISIATEEGAPKAETTLEKFLSRTEDYLLEEIKTNEHLTKNWETSSRDKGYLLRKEVIEIFSNPLIRVQQTATNICQAVRGCVLDIIPTWDEHKWMYTIPSCVDCPAITLEKSLMNPPKGTELRGLWLLSKVLADKELILLIHEFATRLIFSPKESTNVIVTHGDTAMYFMSCLGGVFDKDEASIKRISVENDKLYEFVVRWGRLLSEEEKKTRGLLFSVKNRDSILSEVNTISQCVFWETFFNPNQRTKLKSLHNKLLDFIDLKRKQCPEKLVEFIKQLEVDPVTNYLIPIIKTAWLFGEWEEKK